MCVRAPACVHKRHGKRQKEKKMKQQTGKSSRQKATERKQVAGRKLIRLGEKDKANKQEIQSERKRERGRRQELAIKETEIKIKLEKEKMKQQLSKAIRIIKVQEIKKEIVRTEAQSRDRVIKHYCLSI